MNAQKSRTRWTVLAATALAAALTVGAGAAPALAAPPASASASAAASASASVSASPFALPPLDPAAIRSALDRRPAADVSAGFLRVTGSAGRFEGSSAEAGMAVDPQGRFRIGSISKVFTATVVLQLAAEGRIDLDGSVKRYLPDFPYEAVTVGQLLNHTSGLPGGSNDAWGDGTTGWFEQHKFDWPSVEGIVASMAGQPLTFTPGTEQQYLGMNTFVAGLVVEKVTGHRYADELRDRIIRPLGLHDTSLPDGDDPRLRHPASHPYLTVPDADGGSHRVDVTEQSPWPWAEGGMISSAPDLERFMTALFRGRLLPPAQQEKLFTVPDVPMAAGKSYCPDGKACMSMGLVRLAAGGIEAWGKTGSRPGSTSGVFATRDLSRTVVYSVDPTSLNGAETPYALGLLATAYGLGAKG
ncbi:serine hydrolase domain-containing protein [Kitasatospora brasiliensis]|uniref:serine hydrolase domain-containing protein n=1 Tax=Kitasatospora brasiliensis TaxID=3058040 RepID=UPI002931DCAF|nr:serine hydrolase domain-containing protein [Kitasatospora sp. K002]